MPPGSLNVVGYLSKPVTSPHACSLAAASPGFSLPGFKGKEPEAQAEESVRSTTKKVAQESQQIGLSLLKNFGRRDTNTVSCDPGAVMNRHLLLLIFDCSNDRMISQPIHA